ncbi:MULTISPECIES: preprotein translocase subunit SecY [unclassified Aureispira]|uniref:preprotein translocase subunit SecY n=1 Tax=unclassified Aureispira TaxID=2649989 RepID=UPI000697838E|nr:MULTISPECIES: preprotein translocase subunit SecY [unclassified Aureispira]WMX14806.1 preprotein translocase subunit SecY [Aureispira sp. CCB-E]
MNGLIKKLQDIWAVEELRNRILLTVGFLAVYRFGSFVILPGIDAEALANAVGTNSGGLIGLLDTFTGGSFFKAAVFALGIMPYISASIIVQLLGFAVPYFQKLQKDGENGQRKLNQITRVITIAITIVQGSAYLTYLNSQQGVIMPQIPPTVFWLANIIILTAGTVFCMWLGERITDKGVGNGISLLITAGIIAALPGAFVSEFNLKLGTGQLVIFILEMALFVAVVMASVALVQAVRKIKIQFAKHMIGRNNLTELGTERDYLPIKLNAAGVMPIIFAQALMFVPGAVAGALGSESGFWAVLADFTSLPYNVVFFLLVVIFTYVYTALIVNPQQYADHLKRQNAFIPGVKQGNDTAEYIDEVTTLVTLPGSIALGVISIIPGVAAATITSNVGFAIFFGGTSLLILVAVVLDTLQQIDGHLSMHGYDVRKIKGRTRTTETEDSVL